MRHVDIYIKYNELGFIFDSEDIFVSKSVYLKII